MADCRDAQGHSTWAPLLTKRIACPVRHAGRHSARIVEDDEITEQEWYELDSRFQAKYAVNTGSPYWCLEPTKVLAWNGGLLDTMTRWSF